jgi:fatty acid desaturase
MSFATTLLHRPATQTMTDRDRVREITMTIKDADKDLRKRYGFLKHQDALGVVAFALSAGIFVTVGWLYVAGVLPAWLVVVVGALCTSILREIEHDLIHNLYFRTKTWAQNLLMAAVWPFLGNLPHPWFRREMHLLHHKTSGQVEDFEERVIGNGMPFGWKRILAMIDPAIALFFRKDELATIPFYDAKKVRRAMLPVTFLHIILWYAFLLGNAAVAVAGWFGGSLPATLASVLGVINTIAVVWMLPNVVRQVCLHVLSSNMHYFGDVENRLQETQVMNAWYLLPLNLFTFNFGSTHSIHHYMVNQPFYLRQMCARRAHVAFRLYGLRFNDAGTILRANRFAT